jgi:redox-sensitive bicupin YhaK (pirin superfamily)
VLPARDRQRVGPFIFFDHMGPARFAPGRGIDVRPHPHIGLATVTYLFDGAIQHRDSLGFDQRITPGAVNWMTAGRGIVHSERTPQDLRREGSALHGLQVWLALPAEAEETTPSFVHHPEADLPRVRSRGASLTLIAGEAWGERSPVETASQTFYAVGELESGAQIALPGDVPERAVYLVEGEVALEGETLSPGTLAVVRAGARPVLTAARASRVALAGGAALEGERHLWWNFVSSSAERIEQAKRDWRDGRFPGVPGDPESIPLPSD